MTAMQSSPFTRITAGLSTAALPVPPVSLTSAVCSPSLRLSEETVEASPESVPFAQITSMISSPGTGSETVTLWSYHLPFVPIKARSNSSSRDGTGMSKP